MSHWLGNLQQSHFKGTNNLMLASCSMVQPSYSSAIILVNGRCESYLKYRPLMNELYQLGYSVYSYDHQGQGLSPRLLSNPHKGHVDDFYDYIQDLAHFVDSIATQNKHDNYLLVGHSMGGAIASRYIQTQKHMINKLVLASPMMGIHLPYPLNIVKAMIKFNTALDNLLQRESSFVLGGSNYKEVAFKDNQLTQDIVRYKEFKKLYDEYPNIKLGSPTYKWLDNALNACEVCIADANKINIPTLLMQAGADTIVDSAAQDRFAKNMKSSLLNQIHLENSKHELFFEKDEIRSPVMVKLHQFLSENDD